MTNNQPTRTPPTDSIWIARDADGSLWVFCDRPKWSVLLLEWEPYGDSTRGISSCRYPEIRPGECREFRAVEVQDENA